MNSRAPRIEITLDECCCGRTKILIEGKFHPYLVFSWIYALSHFFPYPVDFIVREGRRLEPRLPHIVQRCPL